MRKNSAAGLTPRSRRSISDACQQAAIVYNPKRLDTAGLGEIFLRLLVEGYDHEHVGTAGWFGAIFRDAPPEPTIDR